MPPEKRIGKQCLRKRRYTRQPDRTVDASQPLAALPCHLLFRSRHLSGSSLGKRFLGTKEVWALITFLVYGVAFHSQSLRIFRKPLFFHIYMILAFLTVLMTYFGVNYVLGGMHSYANA